MTTNITTGAQGPSGPQGATGLPGGLDAVVSGITAAGADQSGATALTGAQNYVATVAAGTGVRLQAGLAGGHEYVTNEGANALLVYPASGVTINSLAANLPVSVPVDTTAGFVAKSATAWRTVP